MDMLLDVFRVGSTWLHAVEGKAAFGNVRYSIVCFLIRAWVPENFDSMCVRVVWCSGGPHCIGIPCVCVLA